MGLWNWLTKDLKDIKFPESLRIYENKETGEYAFEVVNKPNGLGVPLVSRTYRNKEDGIYMTESTNSKGETGFWNNVQGKVGPKKLKELENHKVV